MGANEPQGTTLEEAEQGGWPLTSNATLYVEGDLRCVRCLRHCRLALTYAPLLSEDGKLRNIVVTVRDITHFRTAEEIIHVHLHRQPRISDAGCVDQRIRIHLRRDDAKWDRKVVSESLAVIEEEADRLSRMIDDLLDASRRQAGGLSLNRADVSLPALAGRVAERFANSIREAQHHHRLPG